MKNQKGFVVPILILFGLVILGIVAYFFSPKSISLSIPTPGTNSTENWKVYSSSKHKFTFKIPTNLTVANEFEYDPRSVRNKDIVSGLEIRDSNFTVYSLTIFKSDKLSVSDWVYKNKNTALPEEAVNTTNFSLNGLDIMVYEGNYNKFYLFKKEDEIYLLTTTKAADSEPRQILSTFKFIDENSKQSTLPFDFTVPNGWVSNSKVFDYSNNGAQLASGDIKVNLISITKSSIESESLMEWYRHISTTDLYDGSYTIANRETIMIDGYQGIKLNEFFEGTTITKIYVPRSNYVLGIEVDPPEVYFKPSVQQIIDSIKFINNTQEMCFYNGKQYKVGEQFKTVDGCNTCICEGNQISCTEMACQ